MITPYELAYLSGDAYREDPMVQPASYEINIPQAGDWGVGAHDGVSDSFFCTKYIKSGSFENVIAFRGTGVTRPADVAVDIAHLFSRSSPYISAALSFMRRFSDRQTIVTGHSLGGFIAITMAYHYTIKVAAINPPWTGSDLSTTTSLLTLLPNMLDRYEASRSPSFQSSRIIVYQSTSDVVTANTHSSRVRGPNINFIRIGAHGWHNLDPIIDDFRRNRNYAIRW